MLRRFDIYHTVSYSREVGGSAYTSHTPLTDERTDDGPPQHQAADAKDYRHDAHAEDGNDRTAGDPHRARPGRTHLSKLGCPILRASNTARRKRRRPPATPCRASTLAQARTLASTKKMMVAEKRDPKVEAKEALTAAAD